MTKFGKMGKLLLNNEERLNMESQEEIKLILERLAPLQGKKVLDLGAGTGRISLELCKRGAEVLAVDFSQNAINVMHNKMRKLGVFLKTERADICKIHVKNFDAAVLAHVLEHIKKPDYLLSKIRNYLKPEGSLIIIVPNALAPWYVVSQVVKLSESKKFKKHNFNLYTLRRLSLRSGWRISYETGIGFSPTLTFSWFYRVINLLVKRFPFISNHIFFHVVKPHGDGLCKKKRTTMKEHHT